MTGWRRAIAPGLAAAALGFLAVMVVTGAQPRHRQVVTFEAKGVLRTPPERIRRVEIRRGTAQIAVARSGDKTWKASAGAALSPEAGKRLSMAVQMMHTSAPIRDMPPTELAGVDVAAFDLDPPRIEARLYEDGATPVLTVRFGGHNPDGFLQYMRIDGDPRIYLMSRFVGAEWAEALNASLAQ